MSDSHMDHKPTYPEDATMPSHHKHHPIVEIIQNCEAVCEHMTTHLKHGYDIHYRVRQLQFLRDCADICGLTAKFIARNSYFAKQAAALCAYICEVCGAECARFPDAESQYCAQICMHCAKECRAFAMM